MTHLAEYGLRRFGDLLIPGDSESPSFSASGCMVHLSAVLAEMDPRDIADLQMGATLIGFMPHFVRMALLAILERADALPELFGRPCRIALFNFRALIFSLYYAHPPILTAIGYEVAVYVEDLA